MKNKFFLIPVFCLLIFSCTEQKPDPFFELLEVEYIVIRDDLAPVAKERFPARIVLPVEHQNLKFEIVVQNVAANRVYLTYYSDEYNSYPLFLERLWEGDFFIPSAYIDSINYTMKADTNHFGYVDTSNTIFREYKKYGFKFIMDKYTSTEDITEEYISWILRRNIENYSESVFLKIMYENKFLLFTDCVTGETACYYYFTNK